MKAQKLAFSQWTPPSILILRIIWILLVALSLAVLVTSLKPGLQYYSALAQNPDFQVLGFSSSQIAVYLVGIQIVFAIGCFSLALVIFLRKTGNRMAIFISLIGATFGVVNNPLVYNLHAHFPAWHFPIACVVYFSQAAGIIACYVFPDGRFVPYWTKYPAIAIGAWMLISLPFPGAVFSPERLPYAFLSLLMLGLAGTIIFAQVYRYINVSDATQRQQTKWVVFGIAWAIIGFIGEVILPLVLPPLQQPGLARVVYSIVIGPVFRLSMLVAPLTIAISILRYRLWDIDIVINRGLVYGTLTILLGFLSGASIAAASFIAQDFEGGPLVAVAASAAIFGAIFQPARRRLQHFVDQRFYGIELDYQKVNEGQALKQIRQQLPGNQIDSFGPFKDLELVGRGGMGEVYRTRHPTLERDVAVKILSHNLAEDEVARIRLDHEAQAISLMSHPNIEALYEYNTQDGTPYMVLEFLEGQNLSEMLKDKGRLSLAEAMPILRDVASALDFTHAQGIVHRDIKPSNVIVELKVDREGKKTQRAVLTDFGIAKLYNVTHLTASGNLLGTLDYVSPEQIYGASEVDGRADVYSFGIMAYQLLTGSLPFAHKSPGALVMAHLMQPIPDPRVTVPSLPEEVAKAIMKSLSKEPERRQKTAGELVSEMGVREPV